MKNALDMFNYLEDTQEVHSVTNLESRIEHAIADAVFEAAGAKAAENGGKVSREDFRAIVEESLDTVMGSWGHDGVCFYAP